MDLATCIVQPSGILVITSPGMAQPIMERLDKLILYGDDVSPAPSVYQRWCIL